MKKRLCFIAVLILAMTAGGLPDGAARVSAAAESWSAVSGGSVSATPAGWQAVSDPGAEIVLEASGTFDLETGALFTYSFPSVSDFTVGSQVTDLDSFYFKPMNIGRVYNHSYVVYSARNAGGEGFNVSVFHEKTDNDSEDNKMVASLTYYSPAIVSDSGYRGDGLHYVESIELFNSVFNSSHSLQVSRQSGWYYILIDGQAFVPIPEYSAFDLSEAAVSMYVKAYGAAFVSKINILPTQFAGLKSVVFDGWSTLGATVVTDNPDGSRFYEIKDPFSAMPDISTPFLRETVFSLRGYDVAQPIEIECSYNIVAAPAGWWGLAISKGNPFSLVEKRLYSAMGTGQTTGRSYTADLFANNAGVMINLQLGGIRRSNNGGPAGYVPFTSNAPVDGYKDRTSMDKIKYVIGETKTALYYNDDLIFDDLELKRSDFPGGLAYPIFQFIETPKTR
ncbi:MAG: hypothetical protein FWE62_05705, partial [Firmicutes bacterium]|nr:hypothetical protein [Bacillota bacterium]